MADKPIHNSVKNPVVLYPRDLKYEFHSGCKVIDLTFPNVIHPEVGEIRFKNYYVGILSIRVKMRSNDSAGVAGELKWRTCLRRMKLMPNPHTESSSQDYFTLTRKHFLFDLSNITSIRFILQQPSPVWKDFYMEDLKIFRSSTNVPRPATLPNWLLEDSTDKGDVKIPGVPDVESLSANLQDLWAMAEVVSGSQSTVNLGRYEVDGCYDINLLSYT